MPAIGLLSFSFDGKVKDCLLKSEGSCMFDHDSVLHVYVWNLISGIFGLESSLIRRHS